ncbi:tetratricopeptide repeat protein [Vicingaceae bacterium]|nr:tetratricopeptide repeat protein [Vicingaceae bacterium]
MKNILFLLIFFTLSLFSFCQATDEDNETIENLKEVIFQSNHDSDKVNAYVMWDGIIYISDSKLGLELNQKIEKICLENMNKSPNKSESLFYKKSLSRAYNNIGLGLSEYGDFASALKYHNKGLDIEKKLEDYLGISMAYNNIGNIYADMNENQKAMDYYKKSLQIKLDINDLEGLSSAYTNIGNQYSSAGNNSKAMQYYLKSLELDKEFENKEGIVICLANIANLYVEDEKYEEALINYTEALLIAKNLDSEQGIALILNSIADVYYNQGKYIESINLCEESLVYSQLTGGIFEKYDATFRLFECYKKIGNSKEALYMHEQYILLKDSLANENNQKEIIKNDIRLSYEKQKAIDDAENDKLLGIEQEKKKKQTILTIASASVLLIVIIFLVFVFNRLRITKKQKLIIEEQKHIVEEKNKEITDSIIYAKRIQNAILPTPKIVKEYLQNSFILYKPKDIVAGDFYWLEQKDNKVLFAAADCTGHGVPGAMVSVVCNNALNRSVREFNLTEPGKILDKTRDIVIEEFEKSDEDVQDGMDIALCCLDGNTLKYSGAHNPLWIVRKDELIEIKSDKQPIGKFYSPTPFTTHNVELQKGDCIYIFSDGFVDQFGGEKGKKFKARTFKELLLSIQDKSMEEQNHIINNTFETWRGDLEQIDDVCVIGVRV